MVEEGGQPLSATQPADLDRGVRQHTRGTVVAAAGDLAAGGKALRRCGIEKETAVAAAAVARAEAVALYVNSLFHTLQKGLLLCVQIFPITVVVVSGGGGQVSRGFCMSAGWIAGTQG